MSVVVEWMAYMVGQREWDRGEHASRRLGRKNGCRKGGCEYQRCVYTICHTYLQWGVTARQEGVAILGQLIELSSLQLSRTTSYPKWPFQSLGWGQVSSVGAVHAVAVIVCDWGLLKGGCQRRVGGRSLSHTWRISRYSGLPLFT